MFKKIKALVLFSGGLDSLLAVKVLEKQGIETAGICFSSNFFGAEKAKGIANLNNITLFVEDFKNDILELVKNPPHGLGKNMNPCIDCHAAMFKRAQKFANRKSFDFLASGEVLGQRPFSQNKQALAEIRKTVGIDLLRPLSAKLLPETEMEKSGMVDRKELLDLQGRQRNRQLELVKKFGIREFETPAGGCLLTDPAFGKRLQQALNKFSEIATKDVELLKYGRIYWARIKNQENPILIVIGRNKEDNNSLEKLFSEKDFILKPLDIAGPNILIRMFGNKLTFLEKDLEVEVLEEDSAKLDGKIFDNEFELLQEVVKVGGWYIKKARGERVKFLIER